MTNINLNTKAKALDYLKSLNDLTIIVLPGAHDVKPPCPVSVAVSVITGQSVNEWAVSQDRWEWPLRDLIKKLEVDMIDLTLV